MRGNWCVLLLGEVVTRYACERYPGLLESYHQLRLLPGDSYVAPVRVVY